MTTWSDFVKTIERYRKKFGDDPADLISLWNLDEFEKAMQAAIASGRPMPEAPGGENDIPVVT